MRPASGLGNQLFLYSAGQFVAEQCGKELYIDVSRLAFADVSHGGSMESFKIPGRFISLGYLGKLLNFLMPKFAGVSVLRDFFGIFIADDVGYTPRLESKMTRVRFLEGFFMTDRYIKRLKIRDRILPFQLQNPSTWYEEVSSLFASDFTVAIHVRRGDFLANPNSWGILAEGYYLEALKVLSTNVGAKFKKIVFSDNIELVKNEFTDPIWKDAIFLDTMGQDPAEVMTLFTFADSIILGNSTFSWWGSISSKASFVFAPKPFYKSNPDFDDLNREEFVYIQGNWLDISDIREK